MLLTYIWSLQSAGNIHRAIVLDCCPRAIVKHESLQQQHQHFWGTLHHTSLSEKIRSTGFQEEPGSGLSIWCLLFNTEINVNLPQNSSSPLWHHVFHHSGHSTSDLLQWELKIWTVVQCQPPIEDSHIIRRQWVWAQRFKLMTTTRKHLSHKLFRIFFLPHCGAHSQNSLTELEDAKRPHCWHFQSYNLNT